MSKATAGGEIRVRPLTSRAEFEACVALQRLTWGDDSDDVVPPSLLMVAGKVGGLAAGAFQGDRMLGFVFGISGVRDGRLAHWSHMLAVVPEARDRGVGRQLKEYQRDALRELGVSVMYWTFDPLVARNAHFNITRLGVRVVEYVSEMYGSPNPRSPTTSVIGSDRLVVEWEVGGTAVRRYGSTREAARISIPADIFELRDSDPDAARAARARTREEFERYLGLGYRVTGFEGTPGTDGHYLLAPVDDA